MTTRPTTLVLFDIDGTLVHTAGAGIRGMNAAFRDLHGTSGALDTVPIAGRTDRVIVHDAFRRAGIEPTQARIEALRDAYIAHLATEMTRTPEGPFGTLPGVEPLVAALAARPDVVVALLTGNFERGAEVKLSRFDLWRPFAFGAFGDRHLDRRDLVPLALERARDAGLHVDAARTIVIGDTPLDVDCACAHGARALAVATGQYTADDLTRAGAAMTVATLAELDAAGRWIDELLAVRGA
jgi:phosphoglycolate phosphatase-like HAD superfamily hydrolase